MARRGFGPPPPKTQHRLKCEKYSHKPHYLRKHYYDAERRNGRLLSLFDENMTEEEVKKIVHLTIERGTMQSYRKGYDYMTLEFIKTFDQVIGKDGYGRPTKTCLAVIVLCHTYELPQPLDLKEKEIFIVTAYPL
ncbi:hypothetical protein ACF0H5_016788 [Mactra antiquata]